MGLQTKNKSPIVKRQSNKKRKQKLALLLPAHNEGLILLQTINSAVAAGQKLEHIYIVDDASTDNTRKVAIKSQKKRNILTVDRSGKAVAVQKAIAYFKLEDRYTWLHIADADSIFCKDYFAHYKKGLNASKYSVALGFVQSLKGNWICTYRSLTYTYSQHIFRRLQSYLQMISVFPGPITCFRTSIIKHLDFDNDSLTEDFDITIQVHRKKLGNVKFIPDAINYTQDPQKFTDFCKQTTRWQRGFFQGVKKYRLGARAQRIDVGVIFQITETLMYICQFFIILPMVSIILRNWLIIPLTLMADYIFICALVLFSIIMTRRIGMLKALPVYYFLRWVELFIFVKAFVEVIVLKKFSTKVVGWESLGMRYKVSKSALKETAAHS